MVRPQTTAASLLYQTGNNQQFPFPFVSDKGLSPLTRWAQTFIYNHQHPAVCERSRLLVTDGYLSGFGSEIHVIGTHLAYAIQNNLVLIMSPSTCRNFRVSACQGCECIVRPISHCANAEVINDPLVPHIRDVFYNSHELRNQVPDVFTNALKSKFPSMTTDQIRYWWRGQSSAYILRFNDQTTETVAALRMQAIHHVTGSGEVSFPLQHGSISAHIRGGDKVSEMQLVSAQTFASAIIDLVNLMPNSFSRTVFISGDDQQSIDELLRLLESKGFTVIYTHMRRLVGGHTLRDWRPTMDTSQSSFYGHLLQLLMALEADAWIGTRGSNWNRLIDELRCVWVDKCQGVYVEVGAPEPEYNW